MLTAADTQEQMRPFVAHLVDAAERTTRSRMAAYEMVSAQIGKSPAWIRKLIGRSPDVLVAHHDFLNIRAAYQTLCRRIEIAAAHERAKADILRQALEQVVARDQGVVAGPAGTETDRAGAGGSGPDQEED